MVEWALFLAFKLVFYCTLEGRPYAHFFRVTDDFRQFFSAGTKEYFEFFFRNLTAGKKKKKRSSPRRHLSDP